jgi:hypothetical protein
MILKMIKEEWRKNSKLYNGRSFAAFPLVVLFFSACWNFLVVEFSTISYAMIGNSLVALSALMGIAVGLTGFSSRDAFQNVLGRTNYLVFSSKTLPVSKKRLYLDFFVKDTFFYLFLVVIPISLGFMIPTEFVLLPRLFDAVALFLFGLVLSSLFALSSVELPKLRLASYRNLDFLDPVARKSVIDVFRSSGGLFKIFFSMGVLTFFYWVMVLNFPLASIFLKNPLLSFSVIIGLLNLSIYNWLNSFDSPETYSYLPVDIFSIAHSKETAYLSLALPVSYILVLSSYAIYPGHLILGLISVTATTLYGMAVAVRVLGLQPNERLFQADIFLKYMLGIGALLVPLLYISVIFDIRFFLHYLAVAGLGITGGFYTMARKKREMK